MASDPNILEVFRGDTLERDLIFDDGTDPINISGWTIFFTIKTNQDDTDANAILTKTITSHSDPVNGTSSLLVTASDLDSLSGKYWYDIQVKKSDGTIVTIVVARFIVNKDITRRTS